VGQGTPWDAQGGGQDYCPAPAWVEMILKISILIAKKIELSHHHY